ncbi:unnamed protein product [Rhodiola kirilowii]
MASSIGARTALMRALCRKTSITATGAGASSTATSTFRSRVSASAASVRSGCAHRHPPASTSSRFLRRELSSLLRCTLQLHPRASFRSFLMMLSQ